MQTISTTPARNRSLPATGGESLLTLLGGIWLVAGLFVDGYAHSEIIDTETEDFFTPWHAIFYSGFLFSTAVVGLIAVRRSGDGRPMTEWLPAGYGWAAVGIAVFAVGGVGDGIWHTVFGVETGVDALLSPTHLLLFAGMALLLTAPFRSAWLDSERGSGWVELGGAIASITITTALVAFFFTYAFGLGENWPQRLTFDPITEANEEFVELGLSTAYVATAILVVPVLLLLRRWDLPSGAITVVWAVPVLLENIAFGGKPIAVPSAIAGGLAVELLIATMRPVLGRRMAIVAGVGGGTVALWSVWMGLTHVTEGVAWPPELWTGQILMSAFVALGLGLLAFPPQVPEAATRP